MATKVTKAMRAAAALPQHPGAPGPRAVASEHARETFFASLSRELRCSLDEEGRFLHVEGAWNAVLGWQPRQLRGWYWEEVVHPADRARVAKTLARLRATGGCERELELRLAMHSGGHRVVTWTLIAGSGPDCIIGLGHDRTVQRTEEARGRKAAALLERRNEELTARLAELDARYAAVERFASTAAHQLAEPLVIAESSAILVAQELGEDLDPLLRECLEAIGRGAGRARRLMDALLEDARASTEPLEQRSVDVGEVVEETLAGLEPRIKEQRAVVKVKPLPRVRSDRRLLSVVFDNLVSNALKHGPREAGVVTIGAEPVAGGWRIAVASGGPPIAEGDLRRIFEPFLRLPGERRISGSGLGLAICARLVDRLGGTLGADPGPVEGNTFWFVLPDAGLEARLGRRDGAGEVARGDVAAVDAGVDATVYQRVERRLVPCVPEVGVQREP
jgi:PAS domain S-box-containing protein